MTNSYEFPRVQVIPQVGRASLRIDGIERAGYEFGDRAARPFLFPLIGPSVRRLDALWGIPTRLAMSTTNRSGSDTRASVGSTSGKSGPTRTSEFANDRSGCIRMGQTGADWSPISTGGLMAGRFSSRN